MNPLILAVPRGAVPIGKVIAERLGGDLDVVLVRKIGAPGNPEFAIGAITESGEMFVSGQADFFSVSREYLAAAAKEQLEVLQTRRKLYGQHEKAISCKDRVVILVDDGIATGQTMLAAVRAIRAEQPKTIVVAAPVASISACEKLRFFADRVVVVDIPPEFGAVASFYGQFPQVSDHEVVQMLAK